MTQLMNGGKKEQKTKVDKSKKTAKTAKTAKKENPWLTHVKKTMAENPTKKFKDVLKIAKKTYVKK
jgi:hypothetical protein